MHAQGFVLLKEDRFAVQPFLQALQAEWGIAPVFAEDDGQGEEGILSFTYQGLLCSIALMPAPVPENEAVHNAGFNWMWPEAQETAAAHQAHLLVVVMDLEKSGHQAELTLFAQVVSTCLADSNALGVYTSGTVFAPDFYREMCASLHEGELPLPALVFVGLYTDDAGSNAYTIGLRQFGKEEMEIVGSREDIEAVYNMMMAMVTYVVDYDATLQDGETIGFSAEQKLAISRSPAQAGMADETLKIAF